MSSERGVFLVTGASRGIGAATAKLAASKGYPVAMFYRERDEQAQSVLADIKRAGGRGFAMRMDMADERSIMAGFEAVDRFGRLEVLANNAGIVGPVHKLEEVTVQTLKDICDVNIIGCFVAAREAVRRMSTKRGGQGGAIINVSSGAATFGSPNTYIHYAASKGAIETMTIGLSKEVGPEGIRVNCARPGLTNTEIHSVRPPGQLERMIRALPLGRIGEPEEIAETIVWLASPAASYVTGAILDVRGGM
jgi:NAD(P)-dependent dehydrogenase (short-subunit alcohol dehydrogenase family)